MIAINNGALPNDGTGLKLRDAMTLINENYVDIQSQIDGKANAIHTHTSSEIDGLDSDLTSIENSIIDLQTQINSKADLTIQDQINDLQNIITGLNTMIQQQNSEINDLNELINEIIQNINS